MGEQQYLAFLAYLVLDAAITARSFQVDPKLPDASSIDLFMSHSREVVITGVGVISPVGLGRKAFWSSLIAGRSGVAMIDKYRGTSLPVRFGGQLVGFDPKQTITPRKSIRVMSREVQTCVAAASLAMQDAALERGAVEPDRLGVIYGNEFIYPDISDLSDVMRASMNEGQLEWNRYGPAFPRNIEPLWLLKSLPNMGACHVAIALDARASINTLASGEVSGLLAMTECVRTIERDGADVMIAGGAGNRLSTIPTVYRGDSNLSHRNNDPASASRPFDADRDGMVNGEGAGAIVLEERRHAESRGATILARFAGAASVFGHPGGSESACRDTTERSIIQALSSAGVEADNVGFVVANGLSTQKEDAAEAAAIAAVLQATPVTALKSYFGNLGSGTSTVEAIGGVLALHHGVVPATLNYATPDKDCPINVIQGGTMTLSAESTILLSQNRTGQAAAVMLTKP